jgi:hypothetical protein
MSFCLLATGLAVHVTASAFTLSWTHTVEHTLWQEEWRVESERLVLTEARIKGSGAGMEPPPEARLEGGFYVWSSGLARAEIMLRRDPHAGDWRLCANGRCAELGDWLGTDADPVILRPADEEDCAAHAPS